MIISYRFSFWYPFYVSLIICSCSWSWYKILSSRVKYIRLCNQTYMCEIYCTHIKTLHRIYRLIAFSSTIDRRLPYEVHPTIVPLILFSLRFKLVNDNLWVSEVKISFFVDLIILDLCYIMLVCKTSQKVVLTPCNCVLHYLLDYSRALFDFSP